MSTDFRALCADLLKAVDDCDDYTLTEGATAARARAALAAEADGPAVPEGREPASVVGQPSDELVAQWIAEVWHEGTPVRVAASDLHLASRAAEWGARYAHQPAPPAAGEVAELVEFLRDWGDDYADEGTKWHRAAELLEQRHPAPVPVDERLQQLEDLAADAVSGLRYIEQTHGRLYGVGWDRVYEKADRLQPGHALPLPSGEVQP